MRAPDLPCGETATPLGIFALVRNGAAVDVEVIDLDSGLANDGTLFRLAGNTWVFNLGTGDLVSGTYVIQSGAGRQVV